MGATKKHIYTEEQIALAELFKAFAHPARIAIVETLLEHDDLNCNGLGEHIQLAQSTISGHVKQLHQASVLGVSVVANNAYYQPHQKVLKLASGYLDDLLRMIRPSLYDRSLFYRVPLPTIASSRFFNTV